MKHNEFKQLLQLSLFGELKPEEQIILKEHLLSCEECRTELEDQKNLLELISGKEKAVVDEKVLSAARYQLRGALREERASKNILGFVSEHNYQFFTTPLRFAFAGVALLIVGVLIGSIFFSKSSQSEFSGQQNDDNRFASLRSMRRIKLGAVGSSPPFVGS